MAGLCVLLEKQHAAAAAATTTAAVRTAQVISKTTVLSTAGASKIHGYSSSSSSRAPVVATTASSSSFLHRCFLCRRELADGDDIYIYRGDRAFCSDDCRFRHILTEEDDGDMNCCAKDAAAVPTGRRSRNRQASAGGGFFALPAADRSP